MAKYQTKPVEIEAIRFTGDNFAEVYEFCGEAYCGDEGLYISTLEGEFGAEPGDYIVKGVLGEHYPCKPEAFEWKYEPVDESEAGKLKRHFMSWAKQLRESVKIGRQLTTDN